MKNFKQIFTTLVLALLATTAFAQVKVGDNPTTIDPNAVLEMESTNKGMLLPRVALTATTAAAPLGGFVAGMSVYNTATAGDVTPGYYYCDGTQWVRIATGAGAFEWEDGTYGSENGIYASDALDAGKSVFISSNGKIMVNPIDAEHVEAATINQVDDNGLPTVGWLEGIWTRAIATANAAPHINGVYGIDAYAETTSDAPATVAGEIRGAWLKAHKRHAATSGTVLGSLSSAHINGSSTTTNVTGMSSWAFIGNNFSGSVTNTRGLHVSLFGSNVNGSFQNGIGVDIENIPLLNNPSLNVTNRYGLRIQNVVPSTVAAGATAYSIYTGLGTVSIGDNIEQRGTGYMKVATGTTAQRPATPTAGMIRFNSTTSKFEGYTGAAWVDLH